ncbi:MAG: 50S ribosomal protein L33 [Planctomycetes bacterium]|nr:50S ribosomal protein L33 [Planctomycetota bacterium]
MSQDNMIKLECTLCKTITHYSKKNKKVHKERLEMSKYCKYCKKQTPHKETK